MPESRLREETENETSMKSSVRGKPEQCEHTKCYTRRRLGSLIIVVEVDPSKGEITSPPGCLLALPQDVCPANHVYHGTFLGTKVTPLPNCSLVFTYLSYRPLARLAVSPTQTERKIQYVLLAPRSNESVHGRPGGENHITKN